MQAGPATRACPPKEDTMQITRIRALRGPNLWTRSTAIEAIVQCEPGECDYSAPVSYTHLTLPTIYSV